jgi:hypothetical protein
MKSLAPALRSGAGVLAWALFLAASWTWCIGMYLPVLLVRDLGWGAWLVFALSNVIGAAAMAWMLPDAQSSRRLCDRHAAACRWFSVVTVAFHVFFLCWLIRQIAGQHWLIWAVAFAAMAAVMFFVRCGERIAAAAALMISTAAAFALWRAGLIPRLPPATPASFDLLWLAGVCIFGLTLCPYLDLTFHQARQATTPAGGHAAFAVGFGLFFLAMLLFTLAYSGWLAKPEMMLPTLVAAALGIHLLVQTMLKLILHGRAAWSDNNWPARGAAIAAVAAAAGLGAFCRTSTTILSHLSLGEIAYRGFMAFYGLVFPAYVWICMIGRDAWAGQRRTWMTAVLIAAPMYWLGFVQRQMIWLVPGLAVVLLAKLVRPTIHKWQHIRINPAHLRGRS